MRVRVSANGIGLNRNGSNWLADVIGLNQNGSKRCVGGWDRIESERIELDRIRLEEIKVGSERCVCCACVSADGI